MSHAVSVHSRLLTALTFAGIFPMANLTNQFIKLEIWSDVPLAVAPPTLKSYCWWLITIMGTGLIVLPCAVGNSLDATQSHQIFALGWSVFIVCIAASCTAAWAGNVIEPSQANS